MLLTDLVIISFRYRMQSITTLMFLLVSNFDCCPLPLVLDDFLFLEFHFVPMRFVVFWVSGSSSLSAVCLYRMQNGF